jgi:chromate reductase, NAD(P)H dehydrogenase (quinone)
MDRLEIGVMIGSLRSASYNRRVFESSLELIPDGLKLTEIPIRDLPLYNQEIQEKPTPEVTAFWDAVRRVDGILFISPEYNYSVPGVLKNAFDWASRPPEHAPIAGKPAGLLGASSGRSGTMRMQLHMRSVLPALSMPVMPKPEVFIMSADDVFDQNGRLQDERVRKQLSSFYAAFERWVRRFKPEQ